MVKYEKNTPDSGNEKDDKPRLIATSSFSIPEGKPRVYTGFNLQVVGEFPYPPDKRISRDEIIQIVAKAIAQETIDLTPEVEE